MKKVTKVYKQRGKVHKIEVRKDGNLESFRKEKGIWYNQNTGKKVGFLRSWILNRIGK